MNKQNAKIDILVSKRPIDYQVAIQFMKEKVNRIHEKKSNEIIWFLEHPDLYTCGRSSSIGDIIYNSGIPYYNSDRGGGTTYHGPGQQIIYIMLNLQTIFPGSIDIKFFIDMLCFWQSTVLRHFKIIAYNRKKHIGLWIKVGKEYKKIASLGIRFKKCVSYHGIALNIDPNLAYFKDIVGCGLKNLCVTSISEILRISYVDKENLRFIIIREFINVFNYKINNISRLELS